MFIVYTEYITVFALKKFPWCFSIMLSLKGLASHILKFHLGIIVFFNWQDLVSCVRTEYKEESTL